MLFRSASILSSFCFTSVVLASAPEGIGIPLVKRTSLVKRDNGLLDLEYLARHVRSIERKHSSQVKRASPVSVPVWHHNDGYKDILYSANITVGTPPQTFLMSLDTGSSDIFLPGINCSTTFDCNGHKLYDPSASSTAVDMNKTFTISRDGDVIGEVYTDTVTIGGATVSGQAVGYSTQYPFDYAYADGVIFIPDGVLGLAFPAFSRFGSAPLLQNMVSQGIISSPVFSMKLDGANAEFRLGGTNDALYTGGLVISYIDGTTLPGSFRYWEIQMIAAYAGTTQIAGNQLAIIDTTNHVVLGGKSSVEYAYKSIFGTVPQEVNGSGFYNIPCSWNTTIYIQIGGGKFPIPPASFNLGPWDGSNPNNCLGGFVASSGYPWYGLGSELNGFWILGDVFLRNSYLVFNADYYQPYIMLGQLA